ncbi:MAG: Swt1 family HEPN domain-containing protein [Rhodothermales bacterium]
MQPEHDTAERIAAALDALRTALTPYVQNAMQEAHGAEWQRRAHEGSSDPYLPNKSWDTHALLLIMSNNWHTAFHQRLGEDGRNLVNELRALHTQGTRRDASLTDTYRILDTTARLLRAVGDGANAQQVEQNALAVMRLQLQPSAPAPSDATVELIRPAPPGGGARGGAGPAPPGDDTIELAPPKEPAPADQDQEPEPPAPPQPAAEKTQEEALPPIVEASPSAEEEPTGAASAADEAPETADDAPDAAPETKDEESTLPVPPEDQAADAPDDEDENILAGVRDWFGRLLRKTDDHELTALELRTRLLDEIERSLKQYRSTRPLPINRLMVHILAPTSRERLSYESAIDDLSPRFDQAVRDRLLESGFDVPGNLTIKTKLHLRASKQLEPAFEKFGPVYVEPRKHTARTSATITVLKGKAERATYAIRSTDRTNIGRLREVHEDHYGHLVRRNHIAFLDHNAAKVRGENRSINETVSRRHARIEFDARAGAFFLHNEQGSTSVSREDFPQPVRVGRQPVQLQDGDLIYLGQACIRFETRRR